MKCRQLNDSAIRQSDWKLFLKPSKGEVQRGQSGLYNLASDPGEANDVAEANPEVVAKLQDEAKKFESELQKNKRPAGQLKAKADR